MNGDARKGQPGKGKGKGRRQQIPTQPSPQKTCLNRCCDETHLVSSNFVNIGAFEFAFLVMVKAEVAQSASLRRNDQPTSRHVSRVPHKIDNLCKSVMDLKLEFVETETEAVSGICHQLCSLSLER